MLSGILIATAVVAGVGLLIGIFLGVSGEKFKVEVDENVAAIRECLPGNNCGGCGYPGCDGLAASIAAGDAPVSACPVGGAEAAEKIAAIMGVDAGDIVKMVAHVNCSGDCHSTAENYEYVGEKDCKMMPFVPGAGAKSCSFGCLGYGSCVKVCEQDAIHIVNGIAKVDPEKCGACGQCVKACPKNIISLVPYKSRVHVKCSSTQKGKDVMKACDVGCIGCKKCERTCKFDAIHVENNLAVIDYEKCKNCGMCATACPRNIIVKDMVQKKVQVQPEKAAEA